MNLVQKFLAQSEQRDEYTSRIFRQKAMAVVMDNATITEKEVVADELEAEDESDADS